MESLSRLTVYNPNCSIRDGRWGPEIDVVGVTILQTGPRIELVRNAFELTAGR